MVYKNKKSNRRNFLNRNKFKDEPELVPSSFTKDFDTYDKITKKVCKSVKVGVKVKDAIMFNVPLSEDQYKAWRKAFRKEIADGKTDTPLIRFFTKVYLAEGGLRFDMMDLAQTIAKNGDSSMVQFLIKHRLGYNSSRKQEVELSSNEEAPVKFVFTNMTPTENEEAEKEEDKEE